MTVKPFQNSGSYMYQLPSHEINLIPATECVYQFNNISYFLYRQIAVTGILIVLRELKNRYATISCTKQLNATSIEFAIY
jgi:hypothetical protein